MSNGDQYKDTVFLPKTDFPMRGDLPKREPAMIEKWAAIDLYARQRAASVGKKPFVLHDGPPYANGNIHIGHAVNKILKDIVNRSYQMMGYNADYVPGWDCHGLPIEWKVEEQYRAAGKNKDDVDPVVFRSECRAFAQKWVDVQSGEFQRLGVVGNWKDPYLTMTNAAEAQIAREIHKFLLNGSLYKGLKPVMWSVVEKTALAEAEVEYKEHKSITVWVKFPVLKSDCAAINGASVVIWTTTPWTLPSNRALAYGDKIEYAVYTVTEIAEGSRARVGEKLVLAKSLADDVKAQGKITAWDVGTTLKGSELAGTVCAHPLRPVGFDYDVPMLAGGFVTDDAGTGFVHIAPSHGVDDYFLYIQHYGVRAVPDNVADDGRYRDHVPVFAGMAVYTDKGEMGEGNFAVLKEMESAGALLAKGSIRHEYPHSWRSGAPVIYRTTPQWFIAMDDDNQLRQNSMKAIAEVTWIPAQGETRIGSMVSSRPDWCISRQRSWGVPIPLFMHKETGEPLEDKVVLDRIIDAFEKEGADAWWSHDAAYFLGNHYNANDYDKVYDVVDVWLDSGSTHAFVLEARGMQTPADLYLEGSDQHRGWFQASLLESVGTRGVAPFKTVLTHGFILDAQGYKMSKSKGNVIAPQTICDQYGADILRLWTAMSDYTDDVRVGDDIIKSSADVYRRIRNTYRYLLGALDGFTPSERLSPAEYRDMPELEQLVLHWIASMDDTVRDCIARYDFISLIQELHNFCANELSALYFDIRKDRLYCDRPDLFERRAARTVMAHLFDVLTAWLAPFLCFTAEEAWANRPAGVFDDVDSVHLRAFPEIPAQWKNPALAEKWQRVFAVRRAVTGALEPKRQDKTIGSSLEAHPVVYVADAALEAILRSVDLAEIAITSQVTLKTGAAPAGSFALGDVADIGVEFARAEGAKCQRCWKILPDVGSDPDYPELSARDADAVRWYANNRKAA